MSGIEKLQGGKRATFNENDARYPATLKELDDPPKCLHTIGNVDLLQRPSLAIVGARKATPYGLDCARRFAKRAARRGICIVSGGAIGCDRASHEGALEVGGSTVVVLGGGADVVYPKSGRDLFEEVLARGGTLVSEAPWGAGVNRWCFVRRNRIIAGLARVTLIVEAGLPSGTFTTADATLAQGKDVMAVPGSIASRESRGSNQLLLQGARPVVDDDSFDDAMSDVFGEAYGHGIPGRKKRVTQSANIQEVIPFSETGDPEGAEAIAVPIDEKLIWALKARPYTAEELAGHNGISISECIRILSTLEFNGSIERMRDGRYGIISSEC
ncbi:MAG: DNA-processing protein DprA [Coriobacteriales bacterium]|jgi:DNA processing protein|nr:DNA-processing protein DprA [Coriobacteriales bacterium]